MENAIKFDAEMNTLTITLGEDDVLTYSPETDSRVSEVVDGKILTTTKKGAKTLAAELRCWGLTNARAFEYAVVFWS